MRMRDRLMVVIYSLVFISLAGLVIAVATGWTVPMAMIEAVLANTAGRWQVGIGAALVGLAGLVVLLTGWRQPLLTQSLVQTNELGQTKISLQAIENIVLRAARQIKGVREVKPRIKITAEGVNISLQTMLLPDFPVPSVATELQQTVVQQLQQLAGLTVLHTDIIVDNLAPEVKTRVE